MNVLLAVDTSIAKVTGDGEPFLKVQSTRLVRRGHNVSLLTRRLHEHVGDGRESNRLPNAAMKLTGEVLAGFPLNGCWRAIGTRPEIRTSDLELVVLEAWARLYLDRNDLSIPDASLESLL